MSHIALLLSRFRQYPNEAVVSILLIENGILQKGTKITKRPEGETRIALINTNQNRNPHTDRGSSPLHADLLFPRRSRKNAPTVIISPSAATNQKRAKLNPTPADEQKFLELVNENRNRILRICRVYAWNSADQDDLYQEILFQIWRGLPALKETQFANTWLYRVAINTAISFVRKRASVSDRVVHFEHTDLTRTIESQQRTEENTDDRMASLYTAIYKLNPIEKALVTLFLEDFTYEEIAGATGISTNNVGVMLHRAKKKLSDLMREEASI